MDNVSIPGGVGKLSGLTVKYRILNKFDPRSTDFRNAWKKEISTNSTLKNALKAVGDATDPLAASFTTTATPLDRQAIYAAALSDSSGTALSQYFSNYFNAAVKASLSDATFQSSIEKIIQARAIYYDAWNASSS